MGEPQASPAKQSQDTEEPKSEPEKIRVYGPEPDPNEWIEERRPAYDQPNEDGFGPTATGTRHR